MSIPAISNVNPTFIVTCHFHCDSCCPRWIKKFSCCCPVFPEPKPLEVNEAVVVEESVQMSTIREETIGESNDSPIGKGNRKRGLKYYKSFWKARDGRSARPPAESSGDMG